MESTSRLLGGQQSPDMGLMAIKAAAELDFTTVSRGPAVLSVTISFLILTWVFVLTRLYVRLSMTKAAGHDDWLLVVAQVYFSLS